MQNTAQDSFDQLDLQGADAEPIDTFYTEERIRKWLRDAPDFPIHESAESEKPKLNRFKGLIYGSQANNSQNGSGKYLIGGPRNASRSTCFSGIFRLMSRKQHRMFDEMVDEMD